MLNETIKKLVYILKLNHFLEVNSGVKFLKTNCNVNYNSFSVSFIESNIIILTQEQPQESDRFYNSKIEGGFLVEKN